MWSSFQKSEPSCLFPLCFDVFEPPICQATLSLCCVLQSKLAFHITHLLLCFYCCCSSSNIIKMGRFATFVPCSHFVLFFPTVNQIKIFFFCSKEKHIRYIELTYEYVFICMLMVISLIQLSLVVGLERFHLLNSNDLVALDSSFCCLHSFSMLYPVGYRLYLS